MRLSRLALLATAAATCLFAPTTTSCDSKSSAATDDRPLGNAVPVTGNVRLDNLDGPVDVVRDSFGVIHIYATSVADAFRVQAYQVARDRTVQLELLRRFSEGRTAEVFGDVSPGLIDDDIANRTEGLTRTAQAIYASLDPSSELKTILDAYADGVSQYYARVQTGDEELPKGTVGFQAKFLTPWTGVDSLAIGRFQSEQLSFDADSDISRQGYLDGVRATFTGTSMDPDIKARAGFIRDTLRWAPLDPQTVLPGFPNDGTHTMSLTHTGRAAPAPNVTLAPELYRDVAPWIAAQRAGEKTFGDRASRGSNNWMVSPSKSATGHAMIASDPHLSLSSPAVFWMAHINVTAKPGQDASKNINASGLAFPGIPGFILGYNDDVAWGLTTANYDVTDAYSETLTPDGGSVVFQGKPVAIQKVHETIQVASGAPVEYDVLVVPHHGPIIPTIQNHQVVAPDPKKGALSYRWTGLDPSSEFAALAGMLRAKNVDDARNAVRNFKVGAQNWVIVDTQGNTFYTSQSRIPQRMPGALAWDAVKYQGTLPMFVLPGDGTAEWTHDLDEAFVPHVKNNTVGLLATANADQVGVTLDNDPSNDKTPDGQQVYVGADYDLGLRVGRIMKRLQNVGHPISLDDLASIQADVHSGFGERIVPRLFESIALAQEEAKTPGMHPDLSAIVLDPRFSGANVAELEDWLNKWATESDFFAESGKNDDDTDATDPKLVTASQATLLFNVWLAQMGKLTLDDELSLLPPGTPVAIEVPRALSYILNAPKDQLATLDVASNESILFDDVTTKTVKETRHERAIRALLDAVDFLTTKLGGDRTKWRWGALHALRFDSLVGLWSSFSIPPPSDPVFPLGFPRHGELHTVDVANYGSHPGKLADIGFTYGSGPVQRFVVDMDPKGPVVRNVLPGGNVWDTASPYFRDQAEMWRKNQNHPMWLAKADVIADAKERFVYTK